MAVMTAQEQLAYMQNAIDERGVVLYKGKTIGDKRHLPSLQELAATAGDLDAAREDLERRKQALARDEERLKNLSAGQPLGAGDKVTVGGDGDKTTAGAEAPGAQGALASTPRTAPKTPK